MFSLQISIQENISVQSQANSGSKEALRSPSQWFLDLRMHQYHLESLSNYQLLGSKLEGLVLLGLGGAVEASF